MQPAIARLMQHRPSRQHGAAIVEFALLLVPMLILCFGVAEYGRAIYHYNTVVKSVRSAVRVLSQHNPSDASYDARVTQAKCLAVYGNNECTGSPLAPGLDVSNVKVCDRVAWGACSGAVQSDYNNVSTGLGTIILGRTPAMSSTEVISRLSTILPSRGSRSIASGANRAAQSPAKQPILIG